jgi:hypothetical protein
LYFYKQGAEISHSTKLDGGRNWLTDFRKSGFILYIMQSKLFNVVKHYCQYSTEHHKMFYNMKVKGLLTAYFPSLKRKIQYHEL